MTIGQRIKELRNGLQLTQKLFAHKIGVERQTIAKYEGEYGLPSSQFILAICREFNVNRAWLETGEGEMFNERKDDAVSRLAKEAGLSKLELKVVEEYLKLPVSARAAFEKFLNGVFTGEEKLPEVSDDDTYLPREETDIDDDVDEPARIEIMVFTEAAAAGFGNYLSGNDDYETVTVDVNDVPSGADFGIRISGDSMEPKIKDDSIVWVKHQPTIDDGEIGIFVLNGNAYCKELRIDRKNHTIYLDSISKAYAPIEIKNQEDLRTVGKVL